MGLVLSRVAALCLFLAAGCGKDESFQQEPPPDPTSPEALGPYAIGVTTLETEADALGRVLPVEVWYPASTGGKGGDPYDLVIGTLKLAEIDSPNGAVRDAALDRRGAPYPTILFSHGNGGVRAQSFYLTEYLASHGFVVVAPDHVGNTMSEIINTSKALPPAEAARLRPGDLSLALDTALAANEKDGSRLAGAIDPDRVGAAGHSFGGYTVFRIAGASMDIAAVSAACQGSGDLLCEGWTELSAPFPPSALDVRVKAIVAQAPGGAQVFEAGETSGFSDVAVPVMVQGGTTDQTTPYATEQEAPFAKLPSPAYLVTVENAGHFTFSNMCDLVEVLGLTVAQFDDGCGTSNIPAAEAHALVNRYTTAFFQVRVMGIDDFAATLDPSQPTPSAVTLESH